MRSLNRFAFSAIITVSLFAASAYSSCKKETDKCKNVTCQNRGTCSAGTCTCPTGYTGETCNQLALIGAWRGIDSCTFGSTFDVTMTISRSATDTNAMLINNPSGFGTEHTITGTLSADKKSIIYTNQIINTATYTDTLDGTIALTNNTGLTHVFTAREGQIFVISCSGSYNKL